MTFRHRLMLLASVFIWGSSFVVSKLGIMSMPPFLFKSLRCLCVIPLMFFVPRPKESIYLIMGIGSLWGVLQGGLGTFALTLGVTSSISALIIQLSIFFSALFAWQIIGERLHLHSLVGMFLGFLGVGIALSGNADFTWSDGTVIVFLSSISWALGNVLLKKANSKHPLSLAIWMVGTGSIPLLIISAIFEGPELITQTLININLYELGLILYSGLLIAVLAPYLWIKLLKIYPASQITPYCFLEPVLAIVLGSLFVGEHINYLLLIGLVVVIISLAVGEGHIPFRKKAAA